MGRLRERCLCGLGIRKTRSCRGEWDGEEWERFEKYRWVDVKRWGKENEREVRAVEEAKKRKRKTGEVNETDRR
jgi:hypothetical protein